MHALPSTRGVAAPPLGRPSAPEATPRAVSMNFIDLQVNGYAGVDFNADDLQPARVAAACERLQQDGVASILATIITADLDAMCRRIAALVRAVQQQPAVARRIRGIHLEGPFISPQPGYVGAHPPAAVIPASLPAIDRLVDAGQGLVRLVTLAPERDDDLATTGWLVDRGIVVAAGHCDPTSEQLSRAIDRGLSMFTHLGNGCPLQLHRHDNIIQRALAESSRLRICFIADGVHIPLRTLANYLRLVGPDRAIVVSDAIAAAGEPPGRYMLGGQEVLVDERLATWSPDGRHLMGSACPLAKAYDNLVRDAGVPPLDAQRMCCSNPRQAMGWD